MQLKVIAMNPPGFPGVSIPLAAQRAWHFGFLNIEHCSDITAETALNELISHGEPFGLAVGPLSEGPWSFIERAARNACTSVLLCDSSPDSFEKDVVRLRKLGLQVFVQVTCAEEAEQAEKYGADAIIIKGGECGGRVGEETTFILLQRVLPRVRIPVWARGGVGIHTGAACLAAGAAGVVLDWQLALCRESQLPLEVRERVSRMDGSETAILGQDLGVRYRAYARPGEVAFAELKEIEDRLLSRGASRAETLSEWEREVRTRACAKKNSLLMIGQDAAFAAALANEHRTVKGVCGAIIKAASSQCRIAARDEALKPDGPLAASHGTRYPIVQGPMTRVSDTAEFAAAVAEGGGLPFLALALLRGPQVATLLEETKNKLGPRPWGIGILGFVPRELREEQLAEVRKHPPPYAIIAGGRPDQAEALERDGIKTYLHIPSPALLKMYLESGVRRVIFEGRECGGHVGPRTSFVLWESMIRVILEHLATSKSKAADYHVLFAGGIHDDLSAAMVAAMAAPLSERGVRIGVLMGTSYLFTNEAVQAGAILPGFQKEAIQCRQTILLETGVGHATRCADTEFGRFFAAEKRRLLREGKTKEEIRESLEHLNLGRLRVASKGVTRDESASGETGRSRLVHLDEHAQQSEGMYMIGQVAALREGVCSIEELHENVGRGGVERLQRIANAEYRIANGSVAQNDTRSTGGRAASGTQRKERHGEWETQGEQIAASPRHRVTASHPSPLANEPSDIAIVGMSCFFPKAGDLRQYWENILNKKNAIREIPADRWNWELYFNGDRAARDKIYSKWGGFLDEIPFDPMRYGMPPNSLPSIEPLQLLVLEAVRRAIEDSGYEKRPFNRERTSVVLGAGGGVADLGLGYGFRALLPYFMAEAGGNAADAAALIDKLGGALPEWTEDSFAGLLMNVAAGRIANRFDFGGTNYTVDAACASSLAAVRLAVNELESGASDMVIVGGADTMQSPFAFLCFSKTQALSPTGACKTFDESGDGIVISEGIAMAVLKRLADAERDGDRIYAVIKGVGASSDGKDKGLTAPRPAGQVRALERAYAKAGIDPKTVGLIEAHGTGTVAGDQSEVESLTRAFTAAGARVQSCALGSVKSVIGHTKCTAGVAGLIKAALALHYKTLPPTMGVSKPNPKANFEQSPFYVNSEARPWIAPADGSPRRAGVSAFGFGGTNFHAVLEEYAPADRAIDAVPPSVQEWPAEVFVWRVASASEIVRELASLSDSLSKGAQPVLRDLAACVWEAHGRRDADCCLAIVAASLDDLRQKMAKAQSLLTANASEGSKVARDPSIYFSTAPLAKDGKVAFLFPGQGSQSVNMLRELSLALPGVREVFERADAALDEALEKPLSRLIFPHPKFTPAEQAADEQALTQTNIAQPAIGSANMAMLSLLRALGIRAEMAAGHSYGEYVALHAAGVLSAEDLLRVSEARGRLVAEAGKANPGAMAAVSADERAVADAIRSVTGVVLANLNSPSQTVISGADGAIDEALRVLGEKGIAAKKIRVSCAFHSPLVAAAQQPFGEVLAGAAFASPRIPVYSNTTASPHAPEPDAIRRKLIEHLVSPVRFVDELLAMHEAGARVFIEVGPGRVLTGLTEKTLAGRPFAAVNMDQGGRNGLVQLAHALAQLAAAGVRMDLYPLFEGRITQHLSLDRLIEQSKPPMPTPTTWMVNGAKAVPLSGVARKPVQAASSTPKAVAGNGHSAPAVGRTNGQAREEANGHAGNQDRARNDPHAGSRLPMSATALPFPLSAPAMPVSAGSNGTHIALASAVSGARPAGAESAMAAYQSVMAKFLDTQKNVMLAYLQGVGTTQATHLPTPSPVDVASGVMPPSSLAVYQSASITDVGRAVHAASADFKAPQGDDHDSAMLASPAGTPARHSVEIATTTTPALSQSGERSALTREMLVARLLSIVSDRTGYPPEMLNLESDLEADLGVDSIKRIEILGTLQGESILPGVSIDAEMETLAKLKSLRAIADWIMERAGHAASASAASGRQAAIVDMAPKRSTAPADAAAPVNAGVSGPAAMTSPERVVPRMVLRAVDHPATIAGPRAIHGEVLIVGGDGELQTRLADALAKRRISTIVASEQAKSTVSLTGAQPRGIESLLGRVREAGRSIGGLVYLPPLRMPSQALPQDTATWPAPATEEALDFFNLLQLLEPELRENSGRVIVATGMGGSFGVAAACDPPPAPLLARGEGSLCPTSRDFWPGHAGVCGIAKTINREWPEVSASIVDFEPQSEPQVLPERIVTELITGDAPEIGYEAGQRRTLKPVEDRVAAQSPQIELTGDSVVMITGGARGITAEIAIELGRRFSPKFILIGRSPLPAEEESPQTESISDARQLKALLREQIDKAGVKATPAKIEAAFARLQQDREIRANLAAMRGAGSIVEYHAVDVSDAAAFGGVIDGIYAQHGRIDGVIHGAGVTEDKLIRDKTIDSFRRVLGPKINGACALAAKLRSESLKFLFFFSSVSARYGNRGQADYAAANEFLNKMAQWLNNRWAARVAAINWGPWAAPAKAGGMVSAELAKQFAKAGIVMISRPEGRRLFINELLYGGKEDVEVVYGGPLGVANGEYRIANEDRSIHHSLFDIRHSDGPLLANEPLAVAREKQERDTKQHGLPLLNHRARIARDDFGAVDCLRTLDANYDLYLLDHQLDGRPVMPMAMSLELLAEVAASIEPKMNVTAVRDLRVLKGVMLHNGPEDLRVQAVPTRTADGVEVALKAEAGGDRPHVCYSAKVDLRSQLTVSPAPAPLVLRNAQPLPMSVDEAYERWLFHGPLFAGIVGVQALGENGIIATLSPSSPRRLLAEGNGSHWLIDPVVVDSGLQLLILWARVYMDMTPLPSRLGCYHRNADAIVDEVGCEVHVRTARNNPAIHADLVFCDASGFVVGWLEDMEVTCSKALNRLSATRGSSVGVQA